MKDARDTKVVAGRVSLALIERLEVATDKDRDPFAPTIGRIVARGVELALQELERKRPGK